MPRAEKEKHYIVVTSIAEPTHPMKLYAEGAAKHGFGFVCIGDRKGPRRFELENCEFFSFEAQPALGFRLGRECPPNHYSRKNIGYLVAMRGGARWIVDVDDDNEPRVPFWGARDLSVTGRFVERKGWVNAYSFFSEGTRIWPRGFPLKEIQAPVPGAETGERTATCPVQQGLADGDPDVDAIYRLTGDLPFVFDAGRPVIFSAQSKCPFNSQNTSWWEAAFPLLYLPSHCSFRMTDIWRSFVAQACMRPNGWHLAFHGATVWQERNVHDLLKDFEDEVSGYLGVSRAMKALQELPLVGGVENLGVNLLSCYTRLAAEGFVAADELGLVNAWLDDLRSLGRL